MSLFAYEQNLLALVSAGNIQEDDDFPGVIQNISTANAHAIGRWLAVATNGPISLQLIDGDGVRHIDYTPSEVRAEIAERKARQQQAEDAGASDAEL